MMGEPILKEGYLVKAPDTVKYLLNFKKWQRRWCQLNTNGDLYLFENEKASKPVGLIHLLDCKRLFDAKSRGVVTSFCCGIDMGDMTFYLKAESAKSFKEWIKPMREFAEVCEVDLEAIEERRGTLSDGSRRNTLFSERERTDSTHGRHTGSTTVGKFPSKEGWLSKTGSNNKGWKERYFKLQGGKLFYYKNERTDSAALGDIDLFICTSLENAQGRKGHGIDLHLPGRVYNLSAESRGECEEWLLSLSQTLALVRDIRASPHPRTGSTHSDASVDSQDLLGSGGGGVGEVTTGEGYILVDDTSEDVKGVGVGRAKDNKPEQAPAPPPKEGQPAKDGVVQLLEAEVEALRGQVASLQSEVKANTAVNTQLRDQLSDTKAAHTRRERELCEERDHLQAQATRLEQSKRVLEQANDSLNAQLEDQVARVQELEEDLVLTHQELDDAQTANTAVEEELTDTQQRLQEIESVAHELEAALKKRESEPATPLTASVKGVLYQPHTDSESVPGGGVANASTPRGGVATIAEAALKLEGMSQQEEVVEELRSKVTQLTKDKEDLLQQVASLQAQKGNVAGGGDLEEEQLKRQMEMETLRRELNTGFETEREVWGRERAEWGRERETWGREKKALESEVGVLKEKVVKLESHDRVGTLEQQLTQSQSRVGELEGAVEGWKEQLAQLQVQKDKAMADLIALRKTNKRRMSETEDGRVSSPMSSLTLGSPRVDTPDTGRVLELEKRVDELSTALADVQRERDLLKDRVDRLSSGLQNTPDFGFKLKARASVASSSVAMTTVSPPTSSTHSSQADIANQASSDAPPPKPKRPPKELMTKVARGQQQSTPPLESRLRSRTTTFLKSIKTMIM